jgi:hypothetical protein
MGCVWPQELMEMIDKEMKVLLKRAVRILGIKSLLPDGGSL